jgi:hypothetical protein
MSTPIGPTALKIVSSDINKVGGEYAYLGMIREGVDGREYKLVQSYDISLAKTVSATRQYIVGLKGGTGFKVQLALDSARCNGVTVAGLSDNIVSDNPGAGVVGSYFWIQVKGIASSVYAPGGVIGTYMYSTGTGIGTTMSIVSGVDSDPTAIFTLNRVGVIGWTISNPDSDNLCAVDIAPGYQWTGSGGASVTTGEDT